MTWLYTRIGRRTNRQTINDCLQQASQVDYSVLWFAYVILSLRRIFELFIMPAKLTFIFNQTYHLPLMPVRGMSDKQEALLEIKVDSAGKNILHFVQNDKFIACYFLWAANTRSYNKKQSLI